MAYDTQSDLDVSSNIATDTPISLTLPSTPREIIINGEKFRRVRKDYAATELIKRIHKISQETGCTAAQAAWALSPTMQNQHPFPEG